MLMLAMYVGIALALASLVVTSNLKATHDESYFITHDCEYPMTVSNMQACKYAHTHARAYAPTCYPNSDQPHLAFPLS